MAFKEGAMRTAATNNGVSVKAYAGTTGVMLAMDIDQAKLPGLLGFGIERVAHHTGKRKFLTNLLDFNGVTQAGVTSDQAPFQAFRWSDYGVWPATDYDYTIHPVFGT